MTEIIMDFGQISFEVEREFCHIRSLFVNPEKRGMGLGTLLVKRAVEMIRDAGWDGDIRVVAESQDCDGNGLKTHQLIEWYRRLGLKVFEYYGEVI